MAIDPTTRKGSGVGKFKGRVARALARVRKGGNGSDDSRGTEEEMDHPDKPGGDGGFE